MPGLCFNLAGLDGGVAFNVIPTAATLSFSLRPAPGFDRAGWEQALAAMAAAIDPAIAITCEVDHAPFGGADDRGLDALLAPHVVATGGLDFWTEAALYQAAGIAARVVGPGEIACAHAADEAVAIADLDWAVELFADLYARAAEVPGG
jgi:acetylornithine deacetylase